MKYRKFKISDETLLAEIIRDTWGYNRLSKNPEVALLMGKIYLYSCLCSQNYNLVAEEKGKPVGIIMGNSHKKPEKLNLIYRLKQLYYYTKMKRYKEGEFILNLFKGFERLDNEMLKEIGKSYDGELVFFVTDEAIRGQHVGTGLYRSLVEEFKANSSKLIYVYTDDSCNYGFYEHQGFKRINERKQVVYNHHFQFYVYEKELI
ncbi:GNAT family N-acetyltransferase [Clostridium polynesiense]|uniref:GNAT family N-acetyltransferase n=1 Tax=Clostridium polynesiense TaxID=1325933 RepID=UPI000693692A|nr:GNAT family N-acetyltransferase [Clostridium polynesiense]